MSVGMEVCAMSEIMGVSVRMRVGVGVSVNVSVIMRVNVRVSAPLDLLSVTSTRRRAPWRGPGPGDRSGRARVANGGVGRPVAFERTAREGVVERVLVLRREDDG